MFKTTPKIFVTGFKQKNIQRNPFFPTDADYDYILDEIYNVNTKLNLKVL